MKSASQSGAINHKPPMSEQEFTKNFDIVIKDFFAEPIVEVSFPKLRNNLYVLAKYGYRETASCARPLDPSLILLGDA